MSARTLGPYRLLTALGRGGMGTVWLAETAEPGFGLPAGARVAVKEIHPHLAGVEGFARRFEREGHVGLRLRHENVVRTYGACDVVGADGSAARLLVMEVVEGQTLRAMLEELGRVPEALCRHVGRETAKGLAAIHGAGAVHRDVKPENVIVTPDHVVKLMDLGVARLKDEALRLSQTGTFVGSVLYAAPEQFLDGDDALDGRADLYALGLTLYELATGRHPFASDDLRVVMRRQIQEAPRPASELHPPISAFFDEVLRTLLEKDPAHRFPTAGALAEVLAEGEASAWWAARPVRALSEQRRPARRPRAPRESAMHGRAAEIERLREAFARVRAGEGAAVLLEGEAGIGKTRLVDEWLDELARLPEAAHVLVGGHPGGGVATSAGALAGAFRSHLGGDVRDEAVAPLLRAAPLLAPGFSALLRGDAPPTGVAPLSKDAVQSAFVHAARALSDERPTVILVEDLHNAPEDGLALFLTLALAATGRPLMLVGTARPGLPDTFAAALDRSPVARRVSIGRLGPRDLAALLTEALRSERLAEDLGFRVGAKSDGNPFFVFEILRALRESGRLTKTGDGSWVRTQAIREIEIPSTVRDLVQARLSGLEEEDKDLLDVASCCGDEFDPLLVGEALGIPRIPLLKRLGRLERTNRLVRSVDVRCVFDQRQVREAIYAGLSELLRREYHAALGEALVAREAAAGRPPEAADGATATAISRHLIEGARGERALPWLDRAMAHETRRGHPEGASALIQRALAVPGLLTGRRRAQASLRLSDLLETLGHVAESRPPLAEALALADADGDPVLRSDVRKSLGWADLHAGRPEAGLAELEEARDLARHADAVPALVAALGGIGTAQRILRRHEESVATHREELALAETTGQRALVGTAHSHLGNALWASGRHAEAAVCHQESLAVARELEEPMREATAVGNLGLCMLDEGELEGAARHLGRQLELTRALGYRRGEAIALGNLASVERRSGRLSRTLALEDRHLALCAEIDYVRGLAIGLMSRIETLLLLGDPEAALEVHARAVEACVRAGLGKLSRELDEERAQIALLLGDEATARDCWARRLAGIEDATDRRLALTVRLDLARHHARGGRRSEALGHLQVAVAIAREAASPRELVLPLAWLARLEPYALPEATAALDRHASTLPHVAHLEAQHVLAHATGDATRKVEARWLLDVLVDHAPPARQGPMVVRVPLYHEVRAGLDVLPPRG